MEEVCDLPLRRGRFSSERFAAERMESFWAAAPLAQHDTSKQDDLVLNTDHMLDACRYLLMATMDSRYRGRNGAPTNVHVW